MKPSEQSSLFIKPKALVAIIVALIGVFLLSACANKKTVGPDLTEITVSNTGNFPMQSVKICYYQTGDYPHCSALEGLSEISPGTSYNFFIRANQEIRLVFPFDNNVAFSGVIYRPNCHILLDINASKEKRYHAEAQLLSLSEDPSDGFNCELKVFEQNLGSSNKEEITSKISKTIRYQVPMKGKEPANYISDYGYKY